jgi:hypothetical protein
MRHDPVDTIESARHHIGHASTRLAEALRDAGESVSRHGANGWRQLHDLGGEVAACGHRAQRATRGMIAARPLESALLLVAAGVAIGWLARRLAQPAATAPRRRAPRSTGTRRTAKR